MIVICSWCQTVMRKEDKVQRRLTSHGICKPCSDKVLRELEISKLNAMWRAS